MPILVKSGVLAVRLIANTGSAIARQYVLMTLAQFLLAHKIPVLIVTILLAVA